jgi:hypothetical protein
MAVQALSNNTFRYLQPFKWFKEALNPDRGAVDDSDVEWEWPSDDDTIYDGYDEDECEEESRPQ